VWELAESMHFYKDVLGLTPYPNKPNRLGRGGTIGYPIHLLNGTELSAGGSDHMDLAGHLALEVENLEGTVKTLLVAGLRPFL
jgi:hypothetical protein